MISIKLLHIIFNIKFISFNDGGVSNNFWMLSEPLWVFIIFKNNGKPVFSINNDNEPEWFSLFEIWCEIWLKIESINISEAIVILSFFSWTSSIIEISLSVFIFLFICVVINKIIIVVVIIIIINSIFIVVVINVCFWWI